ncbi:MAG: HAMP domain-containing histidine kinase [Longispora sp.]|nr:HAMP domain-containing histidine kinase [Longispora sp. (in: high G+C Gram-positive bacteria)]
MGKAWRRILPRLRGLRVRLIVLFAVVALASTAGTSALSYRITRNAILQSHQDATLKQFREKISGLAPELIYPPTQETLDQLARSLSTSRGSANAEYRDDQGKTFTSFGFESIPANFQPAELQKTVRESGQLVFQRVSSWNQPYLIMGTSIDTVGDDGYRRRSGVEVYYWEGLQPEQASIDQLGQSLQIATAVALILAILLAALAAHRVLSPVRELGTATRQLAAGRLDTRAAVRGNDELADLARTFNETAGALETSVDELRQMEAGARRFVADVSHELRTPLAAMVAVTDVLDAHAQHLAGDAGSAARLVSAETRNLARLVEDLMEISRFDAKTASLTLDDTGIRSALAETLDRRGWVENVDINVSRELMWRLDPRRFDLIIANLVGNALRHGAPPVQIRAWVKDSSPSSWLCVEVTDCGPGLSDEALAHAFERFYKADSARTRSKGSGLGLSIAYENVALHGGTIHAANRPDGGAVFALRLPQAPEDQ